MSRRSSLAALIMGALLAGCASEAAPSGGSNPGSFPDDPYATQASDGGDLTLEARTAPAQPPVRGLSEVELRVADSAGDPVDDLVITALPWMPDMGHGASVKPTVKGAGGGRYEINHVNMFMPGRWELRLTLQGPLEDSATIAFEIP